MLCRHKVSILLRDEVLFCHSFCVFFHVQKVHKHRLSLRQVLNLPAETSARFPFFFALLAHQQCYLLPKKKPRKAALRAKVCAFVENIYNLP